MEQVGLRQIQIPQVAGQRMLRSALKKAILCPVPAASGRSDGCWMGRVDLQFMRDFLARKQRPHNAARQIVATLQYRRVGTPRVCSATPCCLRSAEIERNARKVGHLALRKSDRWVSPSRPARRVNIQTTDPITVAFFMFRTIPRSFCARAERTYSPIAEFFASPCSLENVYGRRIFPACPQLPDSSIQCIKSSLQRSSAVWIMLT